MKIDSSNAKQRAKRAYKQRSSAKQRAKAKRYKRYKRYKFESKESSTMLFQPLLPTFSHFTTYFSVFYMPFSHKFKR